MRRRSAAEGKYSEAITQFATATLSHLFRFDSAADDSLKLGKAAELPAHLNPMHRTHSVPRQVISATAAFPSLAQTVVTRLYITAEATAARATLWEGTHGIDVLCCAL
jgi:hypothetical protein